MDEVADELFVGTVNDAGATERLHERSITTIVSEIRGETASGYPADVTVVGIPMLDGPQNDLEQFTQAVKHVLSERDSGDSVLVHCSVGASRSPTVAATVLALAAEIGLEAAFDQISTRRRAVDPHDALVRQAARVYTTHRGSRVVDSPHLVSCQRNFRRDLIHSRLSRPEWIKRRSIRPSRVWNSGTVEVCSERQAEQKG